MALSGMSMLQASPSAATGFSLPLYDIMESKHLFDSTIATTQPQGSTILPNFTRPNPFNYSQAIEFLSRSIFKVGCHTRMITCRQ